MERIIIEIGAIVLAIAISVPRRYVGNVAERALKHKITYLDPNGADREYSKWSWEFWR